MEDEHREHIFQLLSALCDQRSTPQQGEELARLLLSSDEARTIYVRYVDLHTSLDRATALSQFESTVASHWQQNEVDIPSLAAALSQAVAPADANDRFSPSAAKPAQATADTDRGTAATRWALVAIVAAGLFVIPSTWWFATRPDRSVSSAQYNSPPVATLARTTDCTWNGNEPLVEGTTLRAGQQLELGSGVARLEFNDQTTVLVGSPSSVELVSGSSLRLNSGTVALRANGPTKDFVVLAPDASFVDRGTSFGVHSGPEGIDVEVFEGKVEVLPGNDSKRSQVLGLGATARLRLVGGETDIDMFAGTKSRFTDLLQMLWEDMPASSLQDESDLADSGNDDPFDFPHAEFSEYEKESAVDTFHGATSGRGWVTPWIASKHPLGEIAHDGTLTGAGNPYLRVRFYRSWLRTIAREYGPTSLLDPSKPHVISWVWRFDGTDEDFGDSFKDRITFFGNPYFRGSSSKDVTWFIGWTGDHEKDYKQRTAIPKKWFVFDGANGHEYDPANLVDTGMRLKRGVVYRMAVVVYPELKQYDAIIQDDEETFVRERLAFRNQSGQAGKVVHFSVGSTPIESDASFSIDSIRIEPLQPDLVPHDLRFNMPTSVTRPPDAAPDRLETSGAAQ